MSLIMPAGNYNIDQHLPSTEETVMVKTASGNKKQVQKVGVFKKGKDALLEAAKKVLAQLGQDVEDDFDVEEDEGEKEENPFFAENVADADESTDESTDESADEDMGEVSEVAEDVVPETAEDKLEKLVDKIEEVAQVAKEVSGEEVDGDVDPVQDIGEVEEVEIEFEADEVSDEDETEGEEVVEETDVESECGVCKEDEKKDEGDKMIVESTEEDSSKEIKEEKTVEASKSSELVAFAKLDAKSKAKLKSYWEKLYPKEYVALMLGDANK
jgi:hypothetical protein